MFPQQGPCVPHLQMWCGQHCPGGECWDNTHRAHHPSPCPARPPLRGPGKETGGLSSGLCQSDRCTFRAGHQNEHEAGHQKPGWEAQLTLQLREVTRPQLLAFSPVKWGQHCPEAPMRLHKVPLRGGTSMGLENSTDPPTCRQATLELG